MSTETGVNRWFFDIYIQGSKYNFIRAESENNGGSDSFGVRWRVSVIEFPSHFVFKVLGTD